MVVKYPGTALFFSLSIFHATTAVGGDINSAVRFIQFSEKTAQTETKACITYDGSQPTRTRVIVINKKGHICDVEGPIEKLDASSSAYVLMPAETDDCALSIKLQHNNMMVDDTDGNCSLAWCGQGVFFGKRTLSRSARQINTPCGAP